MNKKKWYWISQIAGWSIYSFGNLFFYSLQNHASFDEIFTYVSWIPIGIFLTHGFRFFLIKAKWLSLKTYLQVPLVLFSSILMAVLFLLTQYIIWSISNGRLSEVNIVNSLQTILNLSFVLFFWSLIYFSYHFLVNYKLAEIQKLRWQANLKEIELNKLKSQLNPHFMFNSMNSIRALIGEDPNKAKDAVTQLSNILRSTLMMEKNKLIPLDEEIALVKDYLELEKIRFEERLDFSIDHNIGNNDFKIPPLLIQTLAENGIKHGISKLTKGGVLNLKTRLVDQSLEILITNTGFYDENKIPESGFGLKNSIDRLNYIFEGKALLKVYNSDQNMVHTLIIIPKFA